MPKTHDFTAQIVWTGDRGEGTKHYRGYDRTWRIATPGKAPIECSNDPMLGGDPSKPNPEDLLIASLSACHMLWYLHLASNAGIVVKGYEDTPLGVGETGSRGEGRFCSCGSSAEDPSGTGCRSGQGGRDTSRRAQFLFHCAVGEFSGEL